MDQIDFTIKDEALGSITVEEAREHEALINQLNYYIEEGLIEIEEDVNGEIRIYPVS